MQQVEAGKEGEISANIQFTDAFSPGLSIGIGGALIAVSETFQWGILNGVIVALAVQLLFVILSLAFSFRELYVRGRL
ncbi:hypothetical protein [Paenibacillus agri]|uniref:Uncharacterized protein n=1 Tax=Paenibacillus agri TaxID=2744309 RepID=A0A850ETW4_9BACL|nr:hypothetical protein [Paenibacillus agri]NUU64026.1 hypothetical protein [Paenibacillus agri]